jgi:hypothetical protein
MGRVVGVVAWKFRKAGIRKDDAGSGTEPRVKVNSGSAPIVNGKERVGDGMGSVAVAGVAVAGVADCVAVEEGIFLVFTIVRWIPFVVNN